MWPICQIFVHVFWFKHRTYQSDSWWFDLIPTCDLAVGYVFIYPDSHIRLTSPVICFTNYDSQMWFTKRIIAHITWFPHVTCQLDICSCILMLFTCRIFAHVSCFTNIHQARGYATHHPGTFFVHNTIHIAIYCWKTKMSAFIICQWTWAFSENLNNISLILTAFNHWFINLDIFITKIYSS